MAQGANNTVMVFILNYEQLQLTSDCIESLLKSDFRDIDVVVLDNGSRVDASAVLQSRFPSIAAFRSERNLGCAGGRNFGIRHFLKHSDAAYLFLLDNDTVVDARAVGELVRLVKQDTGIGIVSAYLYYHDRPDTIHMGGGGFITWWKGVFHGLRQGEKRREGEFEREVDFVPGGLVLARREAVRKAGVFDERYFIYLEDPDWCFRVKRAGFRMVATARASILHRVSTSVGMESPLFYYYRTRNRLLFMKKNARLIDRARFLFYFPFELAANTIPTLVLNRMWAQLRGVLVGTFDHLVGRYGQKTELVLEFKPIGRRVGQKVKSLIDHYLIPRGISALRYGVRALCLRARPSGVRVLVYHSVDREGDSRIGITPERLAEHLAYCRKAGYRFLTEDELSRYLAGTAPPPGPSVALTFDDGYRDLQIHALPVLQRAGCPAIVFLVSDFVNGERLTFLDRFDPDLSSRYALDEIAHLRAGGISFGSHGRTHRDLRALSPEEAKDEVLGSKTALEARGLAIRSFAFPFGGVIDMSRCAGEEDLAEAYDLVFETRAGLAVRGDRHHVCRTTISGHDTVFDLKMKLAGAYDWYFNAPWVRKWKSL